MLYQSYATSVVNANRDSLAKLNSDDRLRAITEISVRAANDPMLNKSVPLTSEREMEIEGLEKNKSREEDQLLMSGVAPEALSGFNHPKLSTAKRNSELESQGVIVDEELPVGDWKLGYGVDQKEDVKNLLSEYYGTNIRIFKDGEDLIYIDPIEKTLKKVNIGMESWVGKSLPIIGDIAGTIAAGTPAAKVGKTAIYQIGKVVAKESTFAGLGASGMELLRLTIGKVFGVHDLPIPDMLNKAKSVGIDAALWTAGAGSLVASVKGVSNFIKGGVFTREEALKYGLDAKDADIIIDEVNRINKASGGKKEVKGTLFQKTGDIEIGSRQAELERSIEHGKEFIERKVGDQAAITETIEGITKPTVAPYAGKQTVTEVADARVKRGLKRGTDIVTKNVDELDSQLKEMSQVQKRTVGEPTLEYLQKKNDLAYKAQKSEWETVKSVGKFNGKTKRYNMDIPEGESTQLLKKQYKARGKESTTKTGQKGVTSIYREKSVVADLENFNKEISALKADKRALYNTRQIGDAQTKDLGDVISAMEADRASALIKAGKKDLLLAIEKAEKATADYHATYVRSTIGDLLATNSHGVPIIKSKSFVDDMLKRDVSEVDEFVNIIGDNPELVMKWKLGLVDAYRRNVYNGVKFNKLKSNEWFEENKHILSKFGFTKKNIEYIKKTGKFADYVQNQIKRLEQFKTKSKKIGSGKLSSLDPDGLVEYVTGGSGKWLSAKGTEVSKTLNKIAFVKGITKEHPLAWQSFKNNFSRNLRNELIDPDTKLVNQKKLSEYISTDEGSAMVKSVMGVPYYNNLKSVNKVLKMLNRDTIRLASSEEKRAMIQMVRAIAAPPLTRRGRAFTGGLTWETKRTHDVIARSILDEHLIKKVAELSKHDPFTRKFIEKAFSVGFYLDNEINEQ